MKIISILIADDHDVVRQGLRLLISNESDLKIVGEAETGSKAVALAKKLKPDVVLMDMAMPQCNGLDATHAITQLSPTSKVLFFSAYHDDDSIRTAIRAGAAGYLTKNTAAKDLSKAIREVTRGNRFFSPSILKRMNEELQFAFVNGLGGKRKSELTPREAEVVKLIAEGLANKQMAPALGITIKTVEKHRQAAMNKLNLHDIPGLTRYALLKGMVSQQEYGHQASPSGV